MKTRSLNKNPFEKKITFLNSTMEDLKNMKIGSCRLFVAQFMRSKPIDIFIIFLIIIYTLLVVLYLAIDNIISSNDGVTLGLQIFELVLLFIF